MNEVKQIFLQDAGCITALDIFRGYVLHSIASWDDSGNTVFHIELDGNGSRVSIDMRNGRIDYVIQENRGTECAVDRDQIAAALDRICKASEKTATTLERISQNGISTYSYISGDHGY